MSNENKTHEIVNNIISTYDLYPLTSRIDEENMLNKEIIIEVAEKVRSVLFPGFFEKRKVRSENVQYLVGEHIEFIQYHLRKQVAKALGMPDGSQDGPRQDGAEAIGEKKIFRDPDGKKVAGVCSGLAIYLDVDVTLIRILMLLAILFGTAGFWIYIIFWIAVPVADTPAKKCQLRGLAPTPENMSRFTTYSR